jgi:SAM-dependent methyltransferase
MTQRAHPDWNLSYVDEPPPWDIGRPQPALKELFDSGAVRGRVLDVGCGTGEHALLAAARGHAATGVDISTLAIGRAQAKASERHLEVRFVVGSALALQEIDEQFDAVVDCGLFYVLSDDERGLFVASLGSVLSSSWRYFMVCFNDLEPGTVGPRRIRQDEIRTAFGSPQWRVDEISAVKLITLYAPDGVEAWRAAITRQ